MAITRPTKPAKPVKTDSLVKKPIRGDRAGVIASGKVKDEKSPTLLDAGKFVASMTPIIGDAMAAKEVWDEIQREDTNWGYVGALGGAALVGLIPGLGDAAAAAIKAGAKKGLGIAKRIEVDPNAMGSGLGNVRLKPAKVEQPFDAEALAAAGRQGDSSREILVEMPIDDFLKAAKTGVYSQKLAGTRELVKAGTPFNSIPYLGFKNMGDGTGKVIGHEGRHRAMALKEVGETTIPVRLTSDASENGPSIRWGKQNDPTDMDYVQVLPTKLIEEEGKAIVDMPAIAANIRKQRYAQGGVVEMKSKNNKMTYAKGGLSTDGLGVDPVSGNDIPAGSNAEDVRDDLPIDVSPGEYIVPADVVKFVGVEKLEAMVDDAQESLVGMEEDGRIGGEPAQEEMPADTLGSDVGLLDGYAAGGLVPGTDIDGIINRVKAAAMKDPSIINMLKAKGIFVGEPQPQGQGQQQAMAQGQVPSQAAPPAVQGQPTAASYAVGGLADTVEGTSSFNPYAYSPGFSAETSVTGAAPTVGTAPQCSPGFVWDAAKYQCVPVTEAPAAAAPAPAGGGYVDTSAAAANANAARYASGGDADQERFMAEMNAEPADPNKWMEKFDYSNPETLFAGTMDTLGLGPAKASGEDEDNFFESIAKAAGGILEKGIIGKIVLAGNIARAKANSIVLRKSGNVDQADLLDEGIASYIKTKKLENLPTFMTNGSRMGARALSAQKDAISNWGKTSAPVRTNRVQTNPNVTNVDPVSATSAASSERIAANNQSDSDNSQNAAERHAAYRASMDAGAKVIANSGGRPGEGSTVKTMIDRSHKAAAKMADIKTGKNTTGRTGFAKGGFVQERAKAEVKVPKKSTKGLGKRK